MKFPDLFYIKQTRALNNLHDFSVELLARLYSRSNPQNAYDSDWGERQISNFHVNVEMSLAVLGKERAGRLLRHRIAPVGFTYKPELNRDTLRMETIQANIEDELKQLFRQKVILIGWIATAILFASLLNELIQLCFPRV